MKRVAIFACLSAGNAIAAAMTGGFGQMEFGLMIGFATALVAHWAIGGDA